MGALHSKDSWALLVAGTRHSILSSFMKTIRSQVNYAIVELNWHMLNNSLSLRSINLAPVRLIDINFELRVIGSYFRGAFGEFVYNCYFILKFKLWEMSNMYSST
jgi:hypothetical protein